MNLDDFCKTIPYCDRIRLLPSIMIQMARVLLWSKSHNVAHMDIKPANICIKDDKLTFIDWGCVGPICEHSSMYVGTHSFADPSYLEYNQKISHEYDMFSCGLTILAFLTKNYLFYDDEFRDDLEATIKSIKDAVIFYLDERYFNILCSMCCLNEKLRTTPESLYYNTIFDDIRPLYKLPDEVEEEIYDKKFILDDDTYRSIQDFLIDYRRNFLSLHVGDLLEKFLSIKDIEYDISYETACMYIADLLFNSRSSNMTLIEIGAIPRYSKYSVSDIRKKMIEICKALDWKVFPNKSLDDWNMN